MSVSDLNSNSETDSSYLKHSVDDYGEGLCTLEKRFHNKVKIPFLLFDQAIIIDFMNEEVKTRLRSHKVRM